MTTPMLSPRLVVDRADDALAFYPAAFGATERVRFADPEGRIVHAELELGTTVFSVTEHDEPHTPAPTDLGGSGVILTLVVDDVDRIGAAFVDAGGEVLIPIDDRPYGMRDGRFRDPFGHLWLLTQETAHLSNEEIQRRLDA